MKRNLVFSQIYCKLVLFYKHLLFKIEEITFPVQYTTFNKIYSYGLSKKPCMPTRTIKRGEYRRVNCVKESSHVPTSLFGIKITILSRELSRQRKRSELFLSLSLSFTHLLYSLCFLLAKEKSISLFFRESFLRQKFTVSGDQIVSPKLQLLLPPCIW